MATGNLSYWSYGVSCHAVSSWCHCYNSPLQWCSCWPGLHFGHDLCCKPFWFVHLAHRMLLCHVKFIAHWNSEKNFLIDAKSAFPFPALAFKSRNELCSRRKTFKIGVTLKVGSSLVKRLRALLKWAVASRDLGMIAKDMTGSGTDIGSIEYLKITYFAQFTSRTMINMLSPAAHFALIWCTNTL